MEAQERDGDALGNSGADQASVRKQVVSTLIKMRGDQSDAGEFVTVKIAVVRDQRGTMVQAYSSLFFKGKPSGLELHNDVLLI